MSGARAKALHKSRLYQQQFNLDESELLIDEFNCALQQKILLQGKLYISQNYACFHSNIFGSETTKILLASDITGIQLAKVLGLIPNSIRIFTTYETYFFASFLHRDDAYKLLTKMSRGESIAHMGMWAKKGAKTDEEIEDEAAAAAAAGATTPGAAEDGSDGENGAAEGVPRPKKKGHGRSGSMTASPRPAPVHVATSEVRHASLLTGQAAKLKAEKEQKRQNELRETQRKLRNINLDDEEEVDPDDEAAAAEEEEEEEREPTPPPKRAGKGKAAPAAAAAVAAASVAAASVAASKKGGKAAASPRKSTDDGSEGDAPAMPPQPQANGKKGSKASPPPARDDDSDEDPDDLDEEPEPVPAPKKKGAAAAAAAASAAASSSSPAKSAKSAANGSSSSKAPAPSPQSLWQSAASNSGLPKASEMPSLARRARFYELEPLEGGVDPAVVEVQRQFKNGKKLALADPAANRRLLHQGAMRRQGGWNVVDRWCFLFSDHFLFAEYDQKKDKRGSSNYVEKQRIALQWMTVDMRPQSYQQEALNKTKLPNVFRLLDNTPGQPATQYICSTLTAQEKFDWGRRMAQAISRAHANSPTSQIDRTQPGWYTQFVRGLLPQAVIYAESPALLSELLSTSQKDSINDVDQEGNSLLHLCILNRTPDLIPLLLLHGADLSVRDFDGYTPLHLAVVRGDLEPVSLLLASKTMDVSIWHPMNPKEPRFLRDQSCLWLAAVTHYRSNPHKADTLIRQLAASAKAAARDLLDERSERNNMTLLDYCCYNLGMEGVALTIIELGASVDRPNLDGLTPLSQACKAGNIPMISLLLRHGAQPNLRHHKSGLNTSLFHCKGATGLECARELVANGARWVDNLRNKDGVRPKDLFPSISAQAILKAAEESFQKSGPVETSWDAMRPPASSMPQNNRHDFDSCCLCQVEFTLVNKRDYCRRCGWNVCTACSSKRMVFLANSKGKSKTGSSGSSANKERVCDGCYNLTVHIAKMGGKRRVDASSTSSPKKSARGDGSSSVDPQDIDIAAAAAQFGANKQRKGPAADDEDAGGRKGAGRREASQFKSMKRLDVESDDEHTGGGGSSTAHGSGSDSDAESEAEAKARIAEENRLAAAEKAKNAGFGARFMSKFSSSKKNLNEEKESDKRNGKTKQRRQDDDEEEEEEPRPAASVSSTPNKKGGGANGKVTSAAAAAAAATAVGVTASVAASRNGKGGKAQRAPVDDFDDDDDDGPPARAPGWSSAGAGAGAGGDASRTDSDGEGGSARSAGHTDEEEEDPAPKKQNFLQRGLASTSNAMKSAGAAVGGAMTSAARGVSKAARSVKDKVAAATAPPPELDDEGEEIDPDEDPAEAQKRRRKQAARARVQSKRQAAAAAAAEDDEDEDIEDEGPPPPTKAAPAPATSAARKSASTAGKMGDAKKQAARNSELLDQMSNKGDEVEDAGAEFGSLAAKLKARNKAGRK